MAVMALVTVHNRWLHAGGLFLVATIALTATYGLLGGSLGHALEYSVTLTAGLMVFDWWAGRRRNARRHRVER